VILKFKINLPVSILKACFKELVEKNLMLLSAVPPPEANIEEFPGHHPIAFIAAVCSLNLVNYPCFSCE